MPPISLFCSKALYSVTAYSSRCWIGIKCHIDKRHLDVFENKNLNYSFCSLCANRKQFVDKKVNCVRCTFNFTETNFNSNSIKHFMFITINCFVTQLTHNKAIPVTS